MLDKALLRSSVPLPSKTTVLGNIHTGEATREKHCCGLHICASAHDVRNHADMGCERSAVNSRGGATPPWVSG